MKLLDRYVIGNFLQAYLYCIAAFVSIYLIFDISDNISLFLEHHIPLHKVVHYYLTQLPQMLVLLLPVALLLALLFSLGRMSRANEIISMLTAGVSVPRVLLPLIVAGLLTVAGVFAFNYRLAPHAEAARRIALQPNAYLANVVVGQIFRNRTDARTWFIQRFKVHGNVFENIEVLQQDEHDNVVRTYFAETATYHNEDASWELQNAKIVTYDAVGNVTSSEMRPSLRIRHWSETPFRLSSANVRAENMSVTELRRYLHFNADFPGPLLAPFRTHLQYRLALPWTCLVVVLIAAPLGIGFSRRGVLASVASAIILVFAMNFLTHLFLALGEGDRIPAILAGWTPNLIFATVGLWLLYLRATNREGLGFRLQRVQRSVSA